MRIDSATETAVSIARITLRGFVTSAWLICFTHTAHADAWGVKPFENDAALRWLQQLKTTGTDSILNAVLVVNEDKSNNVRADACAAAIAAATLIASARDGQIDLLPAEAANWLRTTRYSPDAQLSAQAHAAVTTCRRGNRSELYLWWMQMQEATDWLAVVKDLMRRLQS